jgi:hypothetical protein
MTKARCYLLPVLFSFCGMIFLSGCGTGEPAKSPVTDEQEMKKTILQAAPPGMQGAMEDFYKTGQFDPKKMEQGMQQMYKGYPGTGQRPQQK